MKILCNKSTYLFCLYKWKVHSRLLVIVSWLILIQFYFIIDMRNLLLRRLHFREFIEFRRLYGYKIKPLSLTSFLEWHSADNASSCGHIFGFWNHWPTRCHILRVGLGGRLCHLGSAKQLQLAAVCVCVQSQCECDNQHWMPAVALPVWLEK